MRFAGYPISRMIGGAGVRQLRRREKNLVYLRDGASSAVRRKGMGRVNTSCTSVGTAPLCTHSTFASTRIEIARNTD